MAPLASSSHRNHPCVFNDAFFGTEVILCHLFVDFVGDILSSRFGLWQP